VTPRASSGVTPNAAHAARVRIVGASVPPLVPHAGLVRVLLVGEAPGPRGADKSGFPFFGDAAGKHLYGALVELGAIALPKGTDDLAWDGAVFRAAGVEPTAHGVALGNAYDRCPTDDGVSFRAPTRRELEGQENIDRLCRELRTLESRGLTGVVTMGRVATATMDAVLVAMPMPALVRRAVPHPSAQGLLSMAPDRGRGARMADLQREWQQRLCAAVVEAGYRATTLEDTA
jgi:uracil-DNA glycosylase